MTAARTIVAVAVLAACGGGDDDGGGDGIDVSGLTYQACPLDRHVGGFDVILGDGYTGVQGQVFDAITPSRVTETLATSGPCAWVRSPMRVCDPACPTGQTCGLDGTCVAQPVAQDVGTVRVEGLKVAVEMPPRPPAYFYSVTGTLPHPGVAPGAGVRLRADGIELLGQGIDPLVVPVSTLQVEPGAAVPLTWTPPSQPGPTRVELSLNVNGHGLVGSHIECVVDDTGAFTIPEPLVTSLLADGLSGFPTLTIRRTTTDSTDTAHGCVELDVEAAVTLDVTIPGLISCDGDEDCTPPATCGPDLTCG
jgi:hypothetical protein